MEAADVNFIYGLQLLRAAHRNETFRAADDKTREQLARIGSHYRMQGMALIMETVGASQGLECDAPLPEPWEKPADTRPGVGDRRDFGDLW